MTEENHKFPGERFTFGDRVRNFFHGQLDAVRSHRGGLLLERYSGGSPRMVVTDSRHGRIKAIKLQRDPYWDII